MHYCEGIDKKGVLLHEYCQSAIRHAPQFRRVVNACVVVVRCVIMCVCVIYIIFKYSGIIIVTNACTIGILLLLSLFVFSFYTC